MVGAIGLAMAVEWNEHGLWHNVVPIGIGVLVVLVSWVSFIIISEINCVKPKHT